MVKKMNYLSVFMFLLYLMFPIGNAWGEDVKTMYGIIDPSVSSLQQSIVSFKANEPSKLTIKDPLTFSDGMCGACVDNTYYYYEFKPQYYGYDAIGFYSVDLETGTVKQIADYGSTASGIGFSNATYDYSSGTMYALNTILGGDGLVKVDLSTGSVTKVCDFNIQDITGFDKNFRAIACNYDGDMYGITYWGKLYRIIPATGECTLIGTLDYIPSKALMYNNSLAFDNDDNTLYWSNLDFYKGSSLNKVDIKTAKVTKIDSIQDNTAMFGMYIPFTVAEASAPNAISNYTLVPGKEGVNEATLTWVNPSKTYGRGGTLENIDSINIYRNNIKIKSFENPQVGSQMTYTDSNVPNGYYAYKIICYNEVGKGAPLTLRSFIGKGTPLPVNNLNLTSENHGGRLTWNAPKKGQLDSYIDTSAITYDIIRYPDTTKVATGIKDTTFLDNTITEVANKYYTVQAITTEGTSTATQSNKAIIGPAITIPHTFSFANQNDFNIWATIDGNANGSTWQWTGAYSNLLGAQCSYSYDNLAAADLMFSPSIELKTGKSYKVMFDVLTGSKKIPEILAFTFGQGTTIENQDSVNQWTILASGTQHVRQNLPAVKIDGEYNFGFYLRSSYTGFNTTIGNISVEEDHEGYIGGKVTIADTSLPIEGATVRTDDGLYTATTDENGNYKLNYLPVGTYNFTISALGYEDVSASATVEELKTTTKNIELTSLPTYKVTGKILDIANDPVVNAKITISGYDEYAATSNADGNFSIPSVLKSDDYTITIAKNKLLGYSEVLKLSKDTDIGTITLQDNIKSANNIKVAIDADNANITWKAPANDPQIFRHDNGSYVSILGITTGTSNSVLGSIYRTPSTVTGLNWYLSGSSTHYYVEAFVFLLDAEGNIEKTPIYHNTNVENTDDQWCSYTLPNPIEAPNGFMIGLSYDYGYLGLAYDSGTDTEYPFAEKSNCYIADYTDTTSTWHYLDNTDYKGNFLLRASAIPSGRLEAPKYVQSKKIETSTNNVNADILKSEQTDSVPVVTNFVNEMAAPQRVVDDRIRYNVYRTKTSDISNESAWTTLATGLSNTNYTDTQWGKLERGVYDYTVKTVYTGDIASSPLVSDSIGKDMLTTVTIKLNTNTPTNESEGAIITLSCIDDVHTYQKAIDENGVAVIDSVWKGKYNIYSYLNGFQMEPDSNVDFTTANEYEKSYTMTESKVQPYHLTICDEDAANEKLLVWNFPDLLYDGFENHEDFMVNSPGNLGWQYYDGDDLETGAISSYTWPNEFGKMAYIVFNPESTTPTLANDYTIKANNGKKFLASFAASNANVANDDWLISPRLYFTEDFQLRFYAKSLSYLYLEDFSVGYSTTGTKPSDFIWLTENESAQSYFTEFIYNVPATAKYITIRHTSKGKQIFFLDDIRIGLLSAMGSDPGYIAPWKNTETATTNSGIQRMPSETGAYEVYLDDKKVANTDETTYLFQNLTDGKHTAGVIASYTSGKTSMSTIDFTVNSSTGISTGKTSTVNIYIDQAVKKLYAKGIYDSIDLTSSTGQMVYKDVTNGNTGIDVSRLSSGVYIVTIHKNGTTMSHKVLIK